MVGAHGGLKAGRLGKFDVTQQLTGWKQLVRRVKAESCHGCCGARMLTA
jgi:hypothetical protein